MQKSSNDHSIFRIGFIPLGKTLIGVKKNFFSPGLVEKKRRKKGSCKEDGP